MDLFRRVNQHPLFPLLEGIDPQKDYHSYYYLCGYIDAHVLETRQGYANNEAYIMGWEDAKGDLNEPPV